MPNINLNLQLDEKDQKAFRQLSADDRAIFIENRYIEQCSPIEYEEYIYRRFQCSSRFFAESSISQEKADESAQTRIQEAFDEASKRQIPATTKLFKINKTNESKNHTTPAASRKNWCMVL
jgi:hypothetical protein